MIGEKVENAYMFWVRFLNSNRQAFNLSGQDFVQPMFLYMIKAAVLRNAEETLKLIHSYKHKK